MMKTSFLFLALFSVTTVLAQTTPGKSTPYAQFGIKAGLNLANVSSNLYNNSENKTGFHAGLLAHIHLNDHVALQPEVVYSQQGFKWMWSSNLDYEMHLDYINIPFLVQYMYKGFRLQTGPQVGFLVSKEGKWSDGSENDLDDFVKTTDFSWDFGASYLTPLGVGVSAQYNLGISNINEQITMAGVSNTDINNRVWQIGLFYQFRK